MSLPTVKASFREYEREGCPLINLSGLELVALWRVEAVFGEDALRRLATAKNDEAMPLLENT
jgi:hypothetical protein